MLGRAVANWVNDHMMVPLDDDDGSNNESED